MKCLCTIEMSGGVFIMEYPESKQWMSRIIDTLRRLNETFKCMLFEK